MKNLNNSYFKDFFSKILFGMPIALFFGIGIFVATDIIQPSFFKNIAVYYPYFIVSLFVGYLSIFLASSYVSTLKNKIKAYIFSGIYMSVEGVFSLIAINTYYGDESIPIIRQIAALCLPLVFSLFFFLKLIESKTETKEEKTVKFVYDEKEIFEKFDQLESIKPDIRLQSE